jgi:sugar-specific transcriptional regulator TrmB
MRYNGDMELKSVLQHLGLNEKEAKVYLALLQLGTASVPAISIKAGTKRPTTYLILEELRMKGLATLLPKKVKALYTAESPHKLLEEQREKEETIEQNMPELMAMYNSKKEKPKVVYYQGEDDIVKLYAEIFKEKEILFYGSIASISLEVYTRTEKYLEIIQKEKLAVREILQADEKSLQFAKDNTSENHQIKIVSKNFMFPTDNMIFGNKVAIITYKDTPMAVVIESQDVVNTYKSMFEIVWNTCQNSV